MTMPAQVSASTEVALALLYHELRPEPSAYSYVVSTSRFAEHLRLFSELREGAPDSYRPLLTFDDGHLSDHDVALPMLREYGLTAHFFITAGWTGKRSGYMGPENLRALHTAGQRIGAHGWSHALLTQCGAAELRHELQDARTALEDWISAPVTSMSLPGGRANERVMAACSEAGYTEVWTSVPKAEHLPLGPTAGRFNILSGATDEFLRRLLNPASGVLRSVYRRHRIKSAVQGCMGDRLYAKLWALLNHQEAAEPGSGQNPEIGIIPTA